MLKIKKRTYAEIIRTPYKERGFRTVRGKLQAVGHIQLVCLPEWHAKFNHEKNFY